MNLTQWIVVGFGVAVWLLAFLPHDWLATPWPKDLQEQPR